MMRGSASFAILMGLLGGIFGCGGAPPKYRIPQAAELSPFQAPEREDLVGEEDEEPSRGDNEKRPKAAPKKTE